MIELFDCYYFNYSCNNIWSGLILGWYWVGTGEVLNEM